MRSEETGGHVSVTEIVLPPRSAGPRCTRMTSTRPFTYSLASCSFQVDDAQLTKAAGEASFAPRNVAHTLANHSDAPARYLLICTPAGFERHWARPTAASRRRTCWETADCPIPRRAAARPKCSSSATARNDRRWRALTSIMKSD